ncbi:MAG: hypothetical protein QM710_01700 [Flavobacterium sp.]
MKYLMYIAAFILTISNVCAQEVKLKKGIVYVDNAPTFSFDKKAMGNELYVYKLNTTEELVRMVVDNNGTESKVDDSKKIVFSQQNETIQSKNFRSQDWDFLIALLLQEKVVDLKGEINLDNLKRFREKYDKGNINHTRIN